MDIMSVYIARNINSEVDIRGSNGSKCYHGMLPGCSFGSKHLLLPYIHGIINLGLLLVFLCNVCNAIRYTHQYDLGSKLLRQNESRTYLLITAPTSIYGTSIIRYTPSNVLCTCIQWLAGLRE